jgi:integrase
LSHSVGVSLVECRKIFHGPCDLLSSTRLDSAWLRYSFVILGNENRGFVEMPRYSSEGKPRGQSLGLSKDQLGQVAAVVAGHPRNAALWATAVCSCLRSSDLLALRVCDVLDGDGIVRERFTTVVRKTTNFHAASVRRVTQTCLLSPQARELLAARKAGLSGEAKLFPLTTSRHRQLVKEWVSAIGLDATRYSGHSTLRSMPSIVYAATKDLAACRQLLGHKDLTHTAGYLSVDVDKAIDVARDVMGY